MTPEQRALGGVIPVLLERPADRLMLCEDAADALARLNEAGLAAGVPTPRGNGEVKSETPLCHNDKRQ